jgi:hypothetical protein
MQAYGDRVSERCRAHECFADAGARAVRQRQGPERPLSLGERGHPGGPALLKEKDDIHQKKLQDLRRDLQIGIDQAERGEVSTFSERTLREIKAEGRRRLAAERKSKSR